MQILGNNECFEPYTSNIYVRRVLSGEFTVVNQHLLMDLTRLGLWSPDLKNELVAANGSIQVSKTRNAFAALFAALVTCSACFTLVVSSGGVCGLNPHVCSPVHKFVAFHLHMFVSAFMLLHCPASCVTDSCHLIYAG